MPFQIIRNDITKVKADAIVNTANPHPVVGSGTDSAIYNAAGEDRLLAERRKIGDIAPGKAVSTPAFALSAKYVIHTVGPAWIDGHHGELETLHACYANSLALAAKLACSSIAFPLIATGVYGFPKDEALQIALSEFNRFLLSHEMKIILVVFDKKAFELSGKLVGDIDEYIDEHTAGSIREAEYGGSYALNRRRREEPRGFREPNRRHMEEPRRSAFDGRFSANAAFSDDGNEDEDDLAANDLAGAAIPSHFPDMSGKSLDEVLGNTGDTFQERLFKLIDASGMDDVTVYKKANIDRKLFSRIRCKPDYKPKKKTAVAFAIALELDMETMTDLLQRAEIAFSPSNKFDLIITYFITNKIYDIYEINAALFEYGQPILG